MTSAPRHAKQTTTRRRVNQSTKDRAPDSKDYEYMCMHMHMLMHMHMHMYMCMCM